MTTDDISSEMSACEHAARRVLVCSHARSAAPKPMLAETSILMNSDILLQIAIRCDDKTLWNLARLGLWGVMLPFVNSSQFWAGLIVSRLSPYLVFNPKTDYRKTYLVLSYAKEGRYSNQCIKEHEERSRRLMEEARKVQIEWMKAEEMRLARDEARRLHIIKAAEALATARAAERAGYSDPCAIPTRASRRGRRRPARGTSHR